MSLPTIPKKNFDFKSKFVPKGKIILQPFTVGQEAVMIQAKDEEDINSQLSALTQVIQECIVTKGVEADQLPMFVLEEIFLRLRQQSAGEIIDLNFTCANDVEDKECGNKIKVPVDLRDMKLVEHEGHTNIIMIEDPIGIKMKYPDVEMLKDMDTNASDDEMLVDCIDLIFDGDEIHTREDATPEEFKHFWNQMSLSQKKSIYDNFWNTIPHLRYQKTITCSKCGHEHEIEFNSLLELFT